ncbi:multiple C2 and transmembrane domain-containing protein 2-like isoform X1 [Pongo pygmaeus]|uniref:multiple C2 and transmembrane domain-containing protein 2-like isoform X1 n=1 Tax=Pongo pygmaeus TaxID=9600 RepID=UPI00300CFF79
MGPAFVILSDLELNRTTEHILKLEDPNSLEDDMGVIILNLNLVVKQGDFKRHSSLICNLQLSESLKRNQLWNGIISITLLEGKTVSGGSMTEIFVQLKLGDQRMGILDIEVWREDSKKQEESLGSTIDNKSIFWELALRLYPAANLQVGEIYNKMSTASQPERLC